jgi:hypothetical protein
MNRLWSLVGTMLGIAGISILLTSGLSASVSNALTSAKHSIGWVGCSNTYMSVLGYEATAGNHNIFWNPASYNTSGGKVNVWADPNANPNMWNLFNQQITKYGPPQIVWVQLCIAGDDPYSDVQFIFNKLHIYAPNSNYYISALNSYNPSDYCLANVAESVQYRDQSVADGLALRGPDLGPLTPSLIPPADPSHCHPTVAGEAQLGGQLFSFFDAGVVTTATPTSKATATRTPTRTKTPVATATSTPSSCGAKPSAPTLLSPPNGATISITRVALDWSDTLCASNYNVTVRVGSPAGPVIDQASNLAVSTYTTKSLTPGLTYFWSVSACDNAGCTSSNSRSFFINQIARWTTRCRKSRLWAT